MVNEQPYRKGRGGEQLAPWQVSLVSFRGTGEGQMLLSACTPDFAAASYREPCPQRARPPLAMEHTEGKVQQVDSGGCGWRTEIRFRKRVPTSLCKSRSLRVGGEGAQ